MKAFVYYITLTEEHRKQLNGSGWSSDIGRQYLSAKDGVIDDSNIHLFEHAATVEADNAEQIWVMLQNGVLHPSWKDAKAEGILRCYTDFPRSMDVGDIVVWENGLQERVASIGVQAIPADAGLNFHSVPVEEGSELEAKAKRTTAELLNDALESLWEAGKNPDTYILAQELGGKRSSIEPIERFGETGTVWTFGDKSQLWIKTGGGYCALLDH